MNLKAYIKYIYKKYNIIQYIQISINIRNQFIDVITFSTAIVIAIDTCYKLCCLTNKKSSFQKDFVIIQRKMHCHGGGVHSSITCLTKVECIQSLRE